MKNQKHTPVLLDRVLLYLRPQKGESFLDVTAGYGGHAQAVLEITDNPEGTVLIDRDPQATGYLKKNLSSEVTTLTQDYLSASKKILEQNQTFDMILADLGASSPQFDDPSRGFSFSSSGPLDMRMDQSQKITAADLLNNTSEEELTSIFREYGEEPKAQNIARSIVKSRPLKNTDELAAITAGFWPRGRKNQATRVFQALRIAINDELKQLKQSLPIWLKLLNDDGRIVLISFHSLEDRIVKNFLADNSANNFGGTLNILTKKPVKASNNETVFNPRARSAKLRAAAKIKTKRKE